MMENSRVNGNYGKEPFRWDWAVIYEMLEYGFTDNLDKARNRGLSVGELNSGKGFGLGGITGVVNALGSSGSSGNSSSNDKLQIAMNTKWIKRLCGFLSLFQ